MPSSYPGSLDSFTRQTGTGTLSSDNSLTHKDYHDNAFDGIEAVQAELGANPAGTDATVVARLDRMEGLLDVSTTRRSKASDTDASSTTDALSVTLAATTSYRWEARLLMSSDDDAAVHDAKVRMSFPGTPSELHFAGMVLPTGITAQAGSSLSTSQTPLWVSCGANDTDISCGVPGSTTGDLKFPVTLWGFVTTDGSGGAAYVKWAQTTSDADALYLDKGSYFLAVEV